MAGFLYFTSESNNQVSLADVRKWGLGYAFDSPPTPAQVTGKGPSGSQGVVFGDKDRFSSEAQIGIRLDAQQWRKMPGSPVWVGFYKEDRPTPADLARAKLLDGPRIELADENRWQVPLARAYSESDDGERIVRRCNLPQRLEYTDEQQWTTSGVLPRYETLWQLGTDWYEWRFTAENSTEFVERWKNFQNQISAAVTVLQANYAIGVVEASLLGILTPELVADILDALIDGKKLKAFFDKKKHSIEASLSSSAGQEDSTATTDPPLPTTSPSASDSPTLTE